MVPTSECAVEQADLPYLKRAAAYCRGRVAMAWSDRERNKWRRLAQWNEELAKRAREDN